MRAHRITTTTATVVLLLALGTGVARGAELTKAGFIAAADKICLAGNAKLDAEGNKAFAGLAPNTQPSPAAIKAFAAKAVPLLRQQSKDIAKLTPPKADQAKVKAMLAELNKAIDKIEKDPTQIPNSETVFAVANKQAIAYGLKVCGK